jgi:acetyl esterase/lipase
MTSSPPGAQRVRPGPRVADLQLRGRAGPLRTRVHWPPTTGASVVRPLLVALPAAGTDALWATVSERTGVVVVAVSDPRVSRAADQSALAEATIALQWAADHADELHADPERLLVGGEGTGAQLAAAVALEARDDGWPSVIGQVLVVTTTSDTEAGVARFVPQLRGRSLAGVAPAIMVIIGDGPHEADARHYASRLRGAGIRVDELHHDGPVAGVADVLAPMLREALGGGSEGPA